MKSIASPTPQGEKSHCKHCGLVARAPMVVDDECRNADACKRRVHTNLARAKAALAKKATK